ncbi:MAG: twin-arginine translocase subunit TatC [Flavobacteriales bacterium]
MSEDGKNTSFLGHLEELRWRLVKTAAVIVVLAVLIFVFIEPLTNLVLMSMSRSSFPTYRVFCWLSNTVGLGDTMCVNDIEVRTIETQMTKQFATSIYFSLVGGIIASFPFLSFQIWSFVKPGLKPKEAKATSGIVGYSTLLFLLGVSFGYFVIAPLCIQFFSSYKMSGDITLMPSFTSYYSLIVSSTIASGLFFQLPIVIFILSKLGMMTPAVLKKYRKHALVGILVLSAVITPPDFISQVVVAIPVFLLYELSIMISRRVVKNQVNND